MLKAGNLLGSLADEPEVGSSRSPEVLIGEATDAWRRTTAGVCPSLMMVRCMHADWQVARFSWGHSLPSPALHDGARGLRSGSGLAARRDVHGARTAGEALVEARSRCHREYDNVDVESRMGFRVGRTRQRRIAPRAGGDPGELGRAPYPGVGSADVVGVGARPIRQSGLVASLTDQPTPARTDCRS